MTENVRSSLVRLASVCVLFVKDNEKGEVVWTYVELLYKLNLDTTTPDAVMKHYLGPVSQILRNQWDCLMWTKCLWYLLPAFENS